MNDNITEKPYIKVSDETEEVTLLVQRRDMSELSEYFEKDSRRYDNGFGRS